MTHPPEFARQSADCSLYVPDTAPEARMRDRCQESALQFLRAASTFWPLRGRNEALARGTFRGGRQSARDRWYGLKARDGFPDFERWWHRVGKDWVTEGRDLENGAEAERAWQEWEELGRPIVKLGS